MGGSDEGCATMAVKCFKPELKGYRCANRPPARLR